MIRVFIDGREGTTGLRIDERMSTRSDVTLVPIAAEYRKDLRARLDAMAQADVAFLCLPDAASREIAALAPAKTRIIDASTAHRTHPDWVYGLCELRGTRERLAHANRIAVPGCHAGGFVTLVAPLVEQGVLDPSVLLSCFSLTGYSGGGKKMIADYDTRDDLAAPRIYGLQQQHKHLAEMQCITGLAHAPIFSPVVSSFYSGMLVSVPLHAAWLGGRSKEELLTLYRDYYAHCPLISVSDEGVAQNGFLHADAMSGRDSLCIVVSGEGERLVVSALFDNLGKGASGAAVQCFNVAYGLDETTGLVR